ncbi:MAG TPA: HAMP domain-containing protein, partial [Candidatus Ozemobacteraceae bacterium]|nr:HAMP domain-containing protein [Candidatus Ozemobacteraceae bacterium]
MISAHVFRRLAAWAAFILFVVLPIGAPVWVWDRLWREHDSDLRRQAEATLERDLQLMQFDSAPQQMLGRSFDRCFQYLSTHGFSSTAVQCFPQLVHPELHARVVVFTTDGKLEVPPWSSAEARRIIQQLWGDILDRTNWPPETRQRMYKALFGPAFFIGDLRNSEGFFYNIGSGQNDGVLLWKKGPAKSGLLMYIANFPGAYTLLRRQMLDTANQSFEEETGFWLILDEPTRRFVTGGAPFPGWLKLFRRERLGEGQIFSHDEYLGKLTRHQNGPWMMRLIHLPRRDTQLYRFLGLLVGLLSICIASPLWWQRGLEFLDTLRISPRLLLFLCLAVLLPSVMLLILSIGAFRERATVLEDQTAEAAIRRLRTADDAIERANAKTLGLYRQLADHPVVQGSDSAAIARVISPLRDDLRMARFDSHNDRNQVLHTLEQTKKISLLTTEMMGREVLSRYLGVTFPTRSGSLDTIAPQFLRSTQLGFARIYDHPGELNDLANAGESGVWFWDFRRPTPERPMAFISIMVFSRWILENFLKEDIPSGVWIFDNQFRRWSPGTPPGPLPDRIVAQAFIGKRSVQEIMTVNGREILGIALPSTLIPKYCFYTLADLGPVRRQVQQLRGSLLSGAVLLLLLALIFSRILSRTILVPVVETTRGIEALENRQFTFRLPDLGSDEFGRLGVTFNSMMEDLRDLDMGREVQASLIPLTPPTIPGYELAISYVSAADLGGDYCDAIPTSGGKTLLIIGDVTGHGVAAALLTAIAKAICFLSAREGKTIPETLNRLNKIINVVLKKKKLM